MKALQDLLPRSLYQIPNLEQSAQQTRAFVPAPAEPKKKIELFSAEFYQACAIGGALACGSTHMAVTPLDVVKCNMQIDPTKYKGIGNSFGIVAREQGFSGLVRGWVPTLIGYGIQGSLKFGLYEYFKKYDVSVYEIMSNALCTTMHRNHVHHSP